MPSIKVWCLANSYSKYVYHFKIYCGKNGEEDPTIHVQVRREGIMARRMVISLPEGLHKKGHVVVIHNYFSSVGLFTKLASLETYATSTI